jgi:hypothetical protein
MATMSDRTGYFSIVSEIRRLKWMLGLKLALTGAIFMKLFLD